MKKTILATTIIGTLLATSAFAQDVKFVGAAQSPISTAVVVPAGYETVYVSGLTPPVVDKDAPAGSTAVFGGSTEVQSEGVFLRIKEALAAEGLGLGDVVMMRVYLVGDPALGGKMDFGGMMKSYKKYFGTADQPKKPARVTTQVAALAGEGMLVEIEVQAVKKVPHKH